MGVTLSSRYHSITIGYGDFFRLRLDIAKKLSPKLGEIMEEMLKHPCEEQTDFYKDLDRRYCTELDRLIPQYGKQRLEKIDEFLWQPDVGGMSTYGTCKTLLLLLKDENDEKIIGYPGQVNPPRMRNLKNVLQECVEKKRPLKWS